MGDPKVAVAYLRVSSDEQQVQQQQDQIERWAQAHGVRVESWHADKDVSGASPVDKRPALHAALAAARTCKAGLLVAWKRDRLARDTGTAVAIERIAEEVGVKVVTADGLDVADSPEGQLVRGMIDLIAQYERALIRVRTRVALQAKKRRGECVGTAPYGYEAVGGKLVPLATEQATLGRMRELKAAGLSNRAIAMVLEREGHRPRGKRSGNAPRPAGERWHVTTVQRALAAVAAVS
jgi:DNA invertase Pin-like site-specific DNA recombinase